MSIAMMTSRWGVQLEGEEFNLVNLKGKINGAITSPASFFITMINDIRVLRTRDWDSAVTASDAFQLALGDVSFIRGCLDILDGCQSLDLGTVYKFYPDGRYDMSRETRVTVHVKRRIEDLAAPEEFRLVLAKAGSDPKLRTAFADLTPDASWIDIYRSWESLRDYFGGEHKIHRAFNGEQSRIKRLTRTANSFRYVKTYDIISDPMPREEAVLYLKDLLQRTALMCGLPTVNHTFAPGQQVQIINYHPGQGQPASLNKLSLVPEFR